MLYTPALAKDAIGRLRIVDLAGAAVPAGAVRYGGLAISRLGQVYADSSAPSGQVYTAGFAMTPSGALYIADAAPSSDHRNSGISCNANGAVFVRESGTAIALGGLNLTAAGAAIATYSAKDYDGTNDYQLRGADLTGIADGKAGTISAWVRFDGGDGVQQVLLTNTAAKFRLTREGGGTLLLVGSNAAGTGILNIGTVGTLNASATYYHILISFNLAVVGARHIYITDVSDVSQTTFTDDSVDYTAANWGVGATIGGTSKFNGCLSELFFHTTYIDLSVEANRRKFIKADGSPAELGADGSKPLGVQPLIYAPNGDASTNLGSGGNFTTTGTLTNPSTTPWG